MGVGTMITEWRYSAQVITTDKDAGDALYRIVRAFDSDPDNVFEIELNPQAWAVELRATATLVDLVETWNSGGYPQPLLDSGVSEADIDALRSKVFIRYYDVYESGDAVIQPTALSDFITAKGYTRVTPKHYLEV